MAVFTKINKRDIYNIQNFFNIGKIISYHGIKEGIENTNYLIFTKRQKFILTLFETVNVSPIVTFFCISRFFPIKAFDVTTNPNPYCLSNVNVSKSSLLSM